jgi:PAS domain-containing protein
MNLQDTHRAGTSLSLSTASPSFAPDWKRFRPTDNPLVPFLAIDAEGTIQYTSKAARRMLEYAPDDSLSPYFFSHIHGKNLYRVMQDVAHMVCCGLQQTSWLLRLRTGRKRWRWYRATVRNRLYGAEQKILVYLAEV